MITSVTRRDLRDLLGQGWRGRLNDAEFLARLYDLTALPSTDSRFPTMLEDIHQHTDRNNDWDSDWIFADERLQLGDDDKLMRLISETLHPEVVPNTFDVRGLVEKLNMLLLPDGLELFVAGTISARPVYSWRRTTPRLPPSGDFPASLVAGLSQILVDITTSSGIDSIFELEDFPQPHDFGSNKGDKVKAWLRTAQADNTFNHWAGLGRVLRTLLEPGRVGGAMPETQEQIREVLAKRDITYLPGGLFTTAPQVPLAGVQEALHHLSSQWTEIGNGGFGTVYRVTDRRLDIDFAFKVFNPFPGLNSQADARARFVREAGLLFRLRHENIVRVFDAGQLVDGRPFIKMEYFDGLNLQKSRDQRPPTVGEAVRIVGKLAAAVEHAHSRSIIHRDIKPSNILASSSSSEVRLIDFGLGIVVEEAINRARLTKSTQQFGDAFAAPELLEYAKTAEPAVDVYSIGAVWFWLHAGHSPKGTGLDASIGEFAIHDELKELLRRCLAPATKRPSATELLSELRAWFRKHAASPLT